MKNRMSLFVVLALSSTLWAYDDGKVRISSDKPLCSTKKCSAKSIHKCSCYCSIKCGPRKIIKGQDTPVFANQDSDGNDVPEQCYCNQMDVDKYNTNCAVDQDADQDDAQAQDADQE